MSAANPTRRLHSSSAPVEALADMQATLPKRLAAGVEPLLVSAKEAANLCGISPATWYRLAAAGKIGPEPLALGARRLYRRADLERWTGAGCPDRRPWHALHAAKNGRRP